MVNDIKSKELHSYTHFARSKSYWTWWGLLLSRHKQYCPAGFKIRIKEATLAMSDFLHSKHMWMLLIFEPTHFWIPIAKARLYYLVPQSASNLSSKWQYSRLTVSMDSGPVGFITWGSRNMQVVIQMYLEVHHCLQVLYWVRREPLH